MEKLASKIPNKKPPISTIKSIIDGILKKKNGIPSVNNAIPKPLKQLLILPQT